MIKSMTGFGQASFETEEVSINIEVKTLNSKFSDTIVKMSNLFSEKEIALKNKLIQSLERGKIVLNIYYTLKQINSDKFSVNIPLVKVYYKSLKETAEALDLKPEGLFKMVMEMPDVYTKDNQKLSKKDWGLVKATLEEAIGRCNEFRIQEGNKLEDKFIEYINSIKSCLEEVEKLDPARIERLKQKLNRSIGKLEKLESFDPNRFEQELIYYVEKLDINEEKVRLKNHIDYFIQTLNSKNSNGKKLGFISQEMGREINTIGSKANDSAIQKLVVNMKEELEKIKEQLLNVV